MMLQRWGWGTISEDSLRQMTAYSIRGQAAAAGVADVTGGWTAILETPDQATATYSRIASDINQRYVIGYYPTNMEQDGKRRRVKIEVKGHPEYRVQGRNSYFGPKP